MALFEKKKTAPAGGCSCGGACNSGSTSSTEKSTQEQGAAVKILGTGCKKCNQLEENAVEALAQLGLDTSVDHVTDFADIAAYGVMTTPALVVDGKVVVTGKVPKAKEIAELIKTARA